MPRRFVIIPWNRPSSYLVDAFYRCRILYGAMTTMQINFDAISVTAAAEIIGCTTGRVRQLLRDGALRGAKLGVRAWAVSRVDAEKLGKNPSPLGRPRKSQES